MAFTIVILIAVFFIAVYAVLIETYRSWFLKVPEFNADNKETIPTNTFSIIIPARDEAPVIHNCLLSVLQQDYPASHFEVILIDDHSTDDTAAIAESIAAKQSTLKIIRLNDVLQGKSLNSYKKKAIEIAVKSASNDWIVTTDADCIVNKNWIKSFDAFIVQNNPVFIAAPVAFTNTGSFVSLFQSLDFMTLQGITAASVHQQFHSMCNGANLAYSKSVFNEVGGFRGIDNIASGDDMLLMHKIYRRYPKQVDFLLSKDSIVRTAPMHSWKAFFNQRIRWASKADKFEDKRIFFVLLFIYLFNCALFFLPLIAFFWPMLFWVWLSLLVAKTIIDLHFTYPVAKFFNYVGLMWWLPVMQPVHIAYTVIAGWLGKFGKYTWKGRTVK